MKFSIKKMKPEWVVVSYSFIIICGDKMCGLWWMSFLGGIFSIDYWMSSIPATMGVWLLGIEVVYPRRQSKARRLSGLLLMYTGLIAYFLRPGASYNYPTLTTTVPQISIGLFVLSSILFCIATIQKFKK